MIFVTLGSQKFQFNRLLQKIDELIANGIITEPVFAQTGASEYRPVGFEGIPFLNGEEFNRKVEMCDLLITHGGSGAIVGAVKKGKRVLAVPRRKQYGEHVDDHQLQLVRQFEQMGIIVACYDLECLEEAYARAKTVVPRPYHSNTDKIIESLEEFLGKTSGK